MYFTIVYLCTHNRTQLIWLGFQVVQRTIREMLAEVTEKDMGYLPSGRSLYSLLAAADTDEASQAGSAGHNSAKDKGTGAGAGTGNALVAILSRVPTEDLRALQEGVERASGQYRYYLYNATMRLNDRDIPTR